MSDYDEDASFFEEDEPADKIFAAFDRGEKGTTGRSSLQSTESVDLAFATPAVYT